MTPLEKYSDTVLTICFHMVSFQGLVVSGRIGTGLLVARLDDRWSAPCALGTVGMGWGMLAGCDINHYLVVLTTHEAVEALLHGTVQLGTEIGIAVGPVGAFRLHSPAIALHSMA